MSELNAEDIKRLTENQAAIENEVRALRTEKQARDEATHRSYQAELGATKKWYNEALAAVNARIAELNKETKGLMPVRPRR